MRGGGGLAGKYFVDLMNSGEYPGITSQNVAIIKCETSATYAITRGEGFKDAVVPAGFNVVEEQHGNSNKDEAYSIMLDYIAKYGDNLSGVFCENDQMALGAAAAIDENGMKGKILVFGFDGNDDAVDAIKEGSMHGTAAQNPYGMGQLGVELALKLVNGEKLSSESKEDGTGNLIFWSPMNMIGNKGEKVTPSGTGGAPTAAKTLTFGWSVYDLANPFFIPMDEGVKAKAAELGITLLPTHDNKSDATEMVTGVTALINQGIDALVISPYSPESLATVKAMADEAGIPVVVVDIGTGGTKVDAFIMSDMRGGGTLAGNYFVSLMNSGEYPGITSKNVAIIKCETSATYAITRGEGFKDAAMPAGYTVVEEQHGNSSKDEAYAIMLDYIAKYGEDLAGVFCENDQMALGAAAAIDENGLKGKILVFGFDGNDDAVDAIKEGSMHGTAAQNPFGMGQLGVELAYRLVSGEKLTSASTESSTGNLIFWSPMNMIGNKGKQV
jgi:ribose transport system substrate-binding protein